MRISLENAADSQLAALAQSGDRAAFDEIVRRHGSFALRVAMRLCRDRAAAEDAAQEAMLRVWNQIHRYDPEVAKFSTWLYRITVNLCIDQSRKWRGEALPEGYDATDPSPDGEATLAARETRQSLAQALRRLPPRQRAAMMLVYEEGLSGAEAAHVLGFSPKAVERLLARARDQLRKTLDRGGLDGLGT
jgi:RNA polymerase sigma-70 factor (ECF subfamily)